MLNQIYDELLRVGASHIRVSMDDDFAPAVGSLLKVENGIAYWHLLPGTLQVLLTELPDNAGSDAVHRAIEANALPVWHGPAPESAEHESTSDSALRTDQQDALGGPTLPAASRLPEIGEFGQLGAALSQLETYLETPVVPGELPSWANAVEKSCDSVRELLRHEIEDMHPTHYAQIRREEPDLLRQVDQMREEDSQLRELYETFVHRIHQFRARSEQAEPNESKLNELLTEVIDEGLAFVIRVRRQELAVSTWLMEAFQRDSGVAG